MLDDIDPCPSGPHEGKEMMEVPAAWLIKAHNKIYEEYERGEGPDEDDPRADLFEYVRMHSYDLIAECPGQEIFGHDAIQEGSNDDRKAFEEEDLPMREGHDDNDNDNDDEYG